MSIRSRVLLGSATVCLLSLTAASVFAAESTFRWRDAQGQVHYSNLLPPEAVDRGYEVFNSNGDIIKRVSPPLTPAQRAAAAAEAKRLEKQAADRAAQQRHDNMLLRTFNTVQDIEHLRDNRLSALEGQLRLVREHQQMLQARLSGLQAREAKLVSAKRAVPAGLRQEIESTSAELADARKTRQALEAERVDTVRRFKADIERFKQLQADGRVQQ
jgi:hypothetical protein